MYVRTHALVQFTIFALLFLWSIYVSWKFFLLHFFSKLLTFVNHRYFYELLTYLLIILYFYAIFILFCIWFQFIFQKHSTFLSFYLWLHFKFNLLSRQFRFSSQLCFALLKASWFQIFNLQGHIYYTSSSHLDWLSYFWLGC